MSTHEQPTPGVTDLDALVATMPHAQALGVTLESATADEVVGGFDWAPDRCTAGGVIHGGALMALADSVGAVCAFLGLPAGAGTATTSSTTHFLRAVREGRVTATARPAEPAGDGPRRSGPTVAATLRVSVRQAVFLAAAGSFAREIRLLARAPGDRGRVGALSAPG